MPEQPNRDADLLSVPDALVVFAAAHRDDEPDEHAPTDAHVRLTGTDAALLVPIGHSLSITVECLDPAGLWRVRAVRGDGSVEYDHLLTVGNRLDARITVEQRPGPDDHLGVPEPTGRDERVPHPPGRSAEVPGPVGQLRPAGLPGGGAVPDRDEHAHTRVNPAASDDFRIERHAHADVRPGHEHPDQHLWPAH